VSTPQAHTDNSTTATGAVSAVPRRSVEEESLGTSARIAWARAQPEVVRAAFEGRRLRSAIVLHARVVDRLVGAHGLAHAATSGHQRAWDELDAEVSRSREELRAMVRRFAFRALADGLSKDHAAMMLNGLIDSALVDAPPQSWPALRTEIAHWGTVAFGTGDKR
jgi:hypothetical protein